MKNKNKKTKIKKLLNDNYGKIFSVAFHKRSGEFRNMTARQGVINGGTALRGGEWANGNAGKADDHDLILVTDINLEKEGKHSRRSIPIEGIVEITVAGTTYKFED